MSHRINRKTNTRSPGVRRPTGSRGQRSLHTIVPGRRSRSGERRHNSFLPPEIWYPPGVGGSQRYRILVQPPGPGLRHVVTPEQIRARLAELPPAMLDRLEVVQLSQVTRKKRRFPCYGMQWGCAIYLYPVEADLVERFVRPPRPAAQIEAATYGGQWEVGDDGTWRLVWTEAAIRDFYLNNILIHELGHLLDDRNCSYVDRERYAEWFAIRYGQSKRLNTSHSHRRVRRRHHAKN
jgi:hypothetical protein